jgi:hypothetical protein
MQAAAPFLNTAAGWAAENPILPANWYGIESDGGSAKVGDGITAWSSLSYINFGKVGTPLVTSPVATVVVTEYGSGRDMTTVLTLTNFVVGALAGAGAALGLGNIVAAFPAGQHFELVYSLSALNLKALGTGVTCKTGLGSVIASGAVAVLSGTATFQDRLTAQDITTDPAGGTAVSALKAATAGIGTGIALNGAANVKNVFLNAAGTWNANNTGNLTASGVIILKWTKMG